MLNPSTYAEKEVQPSHLKDSKGWKRITLAIL